MFSVLIANAEMQKLCFLSFILFKRLDSLQESEMIDNRFCMSDFFTVSMVTQYFTLEFCSLGPLY